MTLEVLYRLVTGDYLFEAQNLKTIKGQNSFVIEDCCLLGPALLALLHATLRFVWQNGGIFIGN